MQSDFERIPPFFDGNGRTGRLVVNLVLVGALANDSIGSDALRTAAVRGRLQATRGSDGQWRSSRNWVDDYLRARYRRM